MIRLALLSLFISYLCIYSFKDWYKALCFVIVLMAFLERPDMPKEMLGISGLNPWNILFIFIFLGWLSARKSEGLVWDMPTTINWLLVIYLAVVVIGYIRLASDYSNVLTYYSLYALPGPTSKELFIDKIVNTIKWVLPGLLVFDGCRSKERVKWLIVALIGFYLLIALQVIKWMPISAIVDSGVLEARSARVLDREIGYYRTDIAMMLAGGAWLVYASLNLFAGKHRRLLLIGLMGVMVLGLALTAGRTGYATFFLIGLAFMWFKWRKLLLLLPIAILSVYLVLPAAFGRFTEGFTADNSTGVGQKNLADAQGDPNFEAITAGRSFTWPFVIDEIVKSPLVGYGREAMQNIGLSYLLAVEYNDSFPHPHNAYLQLLLDNGLLGALPIFLLFALLLKYGLILLKEKRSMFVASIGAMTLAIILAQLIASVGAQSFYPVESSVGLWCAIGLLLRIYIDREKYISQESVGDGKGLSGQFHSKTNFS